MPFSLLLPMREQSRAETSGDETSAGIGKLDKVHCGRAKLNFQTSLLKIWLSALPEARVKC